MSKTISVFIRLIPLDYFFFGGPRTFGEGNAANYYVKSNLFPQQTTIVGLLRYQLRLRGLDFGTESFNGASPTIQSFGLLTSLSPVFLYHQPSENAPFDTANTYWQHPIDAHKVLEPFPYKTSATARLLNFTRQNKDSENNEPSWQAAPVLQGYQTKEQLTEEIWINHAGNPVTKDQIFAETTRVGIIKRRIGQKTEVTRNGFYKQQVYKLKDHWSFGCMASFKSGSGFTPEMLHNSITPFGGERSLFAIKVSEHVPEWKQIEASLCVSPFCRPEPNCYVLLSDALVPPEIFHDTKAAITQTVDFQNIHTPEGNKNMRYAAMYNSKGNTHSNPASVTDRLYKSIKYNLLRRGSVLYVRENNLAEFKKKLEAPNFHNIGYNHYIRS